MQGYTRLSDIGDYEVYFSKYLNGSGKISKDYVAYKKNTNKAEPYRISRSSLKALKKEIEQN